MPDDIRIIPDQHIRVLSADIDAMRQDMASDRAQRRAVAMEQRRALLSWVAGIESEWNVEPKTSDLRRWWREGKFKVDNGAP